MGLPLPNVWFFVEYVSQCFFTNLVVMELTSGWVSDSSFCMCLLVPSWFLKNHSNISDSCFDKSDSISPFIFSLFFIDYYLIGG